MKRKMLSGFLSVMALSALMITGGCSTSSKIINTQTDDGSLSVNNSITESSNTFSVSNNENISENVVSNNENIISGNVVSDNNIPKSDSNATDSENTMLSADELMLSYSAGVYADAAGLLIIDDTMRYPGREFTSYTLSSRSLTNENNGGLQVTYLNNFDLNNNDNSFLTNSESNLAPQEINFYKPGYSHQTYDNIDFYLRGNEFVIEVPFSISDATLQNANIAFANEDDSLTYTFTGNYLYETVPYYISANYNPYGEFEDNANSDGLLTSDFNDSIPENVSYTIETQEGRVNLLRCPEIEFSNGRQAETYTVVIERKSNDLPVLYLTTDSGEDITDRYSYVTGGVKIDNSCGMTVTNGSNYVARHQGTYFANELQSQAELAAAAALDGQTFDISIRGRGNASWWKFPQKSYMLKFDDSVSLFGMTYSNKYALISTYGDPSLVRNCVAMDIASSMSNLEYTTGQIPVDVFLNGTYLGVYTLSEKVDTGSDQINLFSDHTYAQMSFQQIDGIPFLLECGGYVKDVHTSGLDYFYTAHSPQLFVKYPVIEERYNDTITYINNYMNAADQAMTRGYGYDEYIDVDSWVDWFIVMELTNNTDSALCRSTYLYKRADGKLMIGPVWDFDMAFGNMIYDNQTYEYWATAEPIYAPAQGHYMTYLYHSDAFMLAVRERWDEVKEDLLQTAMDALDKYGEQVAGSRVYNNQVRGISGSSYQIEAIRAFIRHRYNWIDMSIHMSDFNRHEATESVPVFEDEDAQLFEIDENAVDVILDENGNPITPTDENGNPIVTTDENEQAAPQGNDEGESGAQDNNTEPVN